MKDKLRFISHYPPEIVAGATKLIDKEMLSSYLLQKYPRPHEIKTDKMLFAYALELKNHFMKKSAPLSKVIYNGKTAAVQNALGTHNFVSRVQGGKLKAKNEIHISTLFKQAPEAFLRMIVVHELAHFKVKEHNKAFYKLCTHMEAGYHQLEFDCRLYLIQLEHFGKLYR
jgi:predicted metal-dependent hydrolase